MFGAVGGHGLLAEVLGVEVCLGLMVVTECSVRFWEWRYVINAMGEIVAHKSYFEGNVAGMVCETKGCADLSLSMFFFFNFKKTNQTKQNETARHGRGQEECRAPRSVRSQNKVQSAERLWERSLCEALRRCRKNEFLALLRASVFL